MKGLYVFIFSILIFSLLSSRCDDKPDESILEDYNKKTLLINIADNYITPAYLNYKIETESLHNSIGVFIASPSAVLLEKCKTQLLVTTLSWQSIAFLEFGPAEEISLRSQTNIFPTDTTLINANILSNTYNLQLPSNYDAKGLQALDYLLFKSELNSLADYYTNNTNAKNYLLAISEEIKVNAKSVYEAWSPYRSTFINDSENNAQGSAISNFVNSFSLHFETFVRKGKIGIPLGVFNGISGTTLPTHVEGKYSKKSIDYSIQLMQSLLSCFKGNNFNTNSDGEGLDNYLNHLESKFGSELLSTVIESKIQLIISNLQSINTDLSTAIINLNTNVDKTYQSMQELVPLLKVELTSAIGILVSYQDNDGD